LAFTAGLSSGLTKAPPKTAEGNVRHPAIKMHINKRTVFIIQNS
jgi:hypothetical protein